MYAERPVASPLIACTWEQTVGADATEQLVVSLAVRALEVGYAD